ncbi:MAG: hypothetical protein ABJ360_20750 [Roseobacter sp.]
MKLMLIACFSALLSACAVPSFVGDAAPVSVTNRTPDHFELPARFAVARVVHGRSQTAGAKEAALWADLAERVESFGSFTPLVDPILVGRKRYNRYNQKNLIETARTQRYKYLLLVRMYPSTGSSDATIVHVGSGGVMATVQTISPEGGQRGFWGGRINNPRRLDRATFKIAKTTIPAVEDMLRGAAERQH